MSADIEIRRLAPEQFTIFAKLIASLADFEKLTPPNKHALQRLYKHAFSQPPKFEAFLAYLGEQPAGYAIIFETYSSFLAKPTLYLEDIFVLPEYRSKKVGYALFSFLAKEALKRDCGRMEWQVLHWNELALNFYHKLKAEHLKDWLPYRLDEYGLRQIVEIR